MVKGQMFVLSQECKMYCVLNFCLESGYKVSLITTCMNVLLQFKCQSDILKILKRHLHLNLIHNIKLHVYEGTKKHMNTEAGSII